MFLEVSYTILFKSCWKLGMGGGGAGIWSHQIVSRSIVNLRKGLNQITDLFKGLKKNSEHQDEQQV